MKIESKWEIIRVSDICEIGRGRVINKKEIEENFGEYPVYSSQTSNDGIFGFLNTYDFEGEYVTWTTDGIYAGSVFYRNGKFNCTNVCGTLKSKSKKINMQFLSLCLPLYTSDYVVKVANPKLMNNVMAGIQIPLPPLDIQQKIVSEIEVLEAKEKKAKEEVNYFIQTKNEIIEKLFSQNKYTEISHIAKVLGGKRIPKGLSFSPNKTEYPYLRVSDFKNGTIDFRNLKYIDEDVFKQISNYTISKEDIYISIAGTIGLVGLIPEKLDGKSLTENAAKIVINTKDLISKEFLYYCLISENLQKQIEDNTRAVGVPKLALKRIETLKIPLPPLSEQEKIVSEIKKIEAKIKVLETEIAEIPKQKEAILQKYLQ